MPPHAPLPSFVDWQHTLITLQDLESRTPRESITKAIREIAWELSELAFRVELYELDRFMCPASRGELDVPENDRRKLLERVFPDCHFVLPLTPPRHHQGLFAPDVRDRAWSLEGLRRLIIRWPSHPRAFDKIVFTPTSPDDELLAFEREAAALYCQQFYEWLGRAPVVPRSPPA